MTNARYYTLTSKVVVTKQCSFVARDGLTKQELIRIANARMMWEDIGQIVTQTEIVSRPTTESAPEPTST